MITQQITAVALKLIAIWLVLQMFLNVPSLVMLSTHLEQYQQKAIPAVIYFWMITCFLVVGLVAAYLVFKTAASVLATAKTDTPLALGEDSQKNTVPACRYLFCCAFTGSASCLIVLYPYSTSRRHGQYTGTAGYYYPVTGRFMVNAVFRLLGRINATFEKCITN